MRITLLRLPSSEAGVRIAGEASAFKAIHRQAGTHEKGDILGRRDGLLAVCPSMPHAVRRRMSDPLSPSDRPGVALKESQSGGRIVVIHLIVPGGHVYDDHPTPVVELHFRPQFLVHGPSELFYIQSFV